MLEWLHVFLGIVMVFLFVVSVIGGIIAGFALGIYLFEKITGYKFGG